MMNRRRLVFNSSLVIPHSSFPLLVVRDADEVGAGGELVVSVGSLGVGLELRRGGLVEGFGSPAVRALFVVAVHHAAHVVHDGVAAGARVWRAVVVVSVRGLLVFLRVVLVVAVRVRGLFANLVGYLAEVYEVVGHVYQLRRGVRAEARDLDAAALLGDGVDCVDEVLVARDEHGSVVAPGEREHVDGDLYVEVRLARPVVEGLQFFVYDAEAVATHPEEEALLALGADVHAGVEEGAQKPPVAQENAKELVVVYVYVVEPRRVEKVVAVDENRHPASVT